MRLCFIGNANSVHTRRWIEPFMARGDTVTLLTYQPMKGQPPATEVVDLTQLVDWPKMRFAFWGLWIRRYLRRLQPDILHAQQVQAAGWLGALSGFHPFVVTAWGSDLLVEPHRSAFRRTLVRLVLRSCDCLTVPSQTLLDSALDLGVPGSKIRLIPWGIETDVFRPVPDDRLVTRAQLKIDPRANVLLCPRGISPLYNLDILLIALEKLCKEDADICLVLLRFNVDESYMAHLQNLIEALGLQERIYWLPARHTGVEMAQLYRMADVTVSIPSSEGYGFSVFEAMACGCPTLISDLPVFRHELRHAVHTMKVPVRDVNRTSQTLASLLYDDNLRQTARVNGLDLVSQKSIRRRAEEVSQLYDSIAAAREGIRRS